MTKRECTCRRWELTGIPCKHVVEAINNMARNDMDPNGNHGGIPKDWVSPCYWLSTWKEMYQYKIEGIAGSSFWLKCTIPRNLKPPHHHVPIGRPRKKRRQSKDEIAEQAMKKSMVKNGKLSKRARKSNVVHVVGWVTIRELVRVQETTKRRVWEQELLSQWDHLQQMWEQAKPTSWNTSKWCSSRAKSTSWTTSKWGINSEWWRIKKKVKVAKWVKTIVMVQ